MVAGLLAAQSSAAAMAPSSRTPLAHSALSMPDALPLKLNSGGGCSTGSEAAAAGASGVAAGASGAAAGASGGGGGGGSGG
jgi:hypothetical protein